MKKFWIVNKINDTKAEVLLYGYIYDVCASEFVKELQALEKLYSIIDVRINSGGGDVFDGMAIYNAMKRSPAVIDTYCDGLAASMGSIVFQGGRKRYISKVGQMMTHKPSAGGYGNSEELRNIAELADSMEDMMAAIYASRTGKTKDECKTLFMNGKDKWFTAEESVKAGLADEVYDAAELALPSIAANNEEQLWKGYHELRFAAIYNQSKNENSNMEKIILNAASLTALGLTGDADNTAINAKIAEQAGRVVALTNDVATANAAKKVAEDALAVLKTTTTEKEVTDMLSVAVTEKRITQDASNKMKVQFAGKPTELKELLEAMPVYESLTGKLKESPAAMKKFEGKSWEELDKAGLLPALKAANIELFKQLFSEAHNGKEWTGDDKK